MRRGSAVELIAKLVNHDAARRIALPPIVRRGRGDEEAARPQAGTGVQMFPFLDAMVCTLGALLVLLHAFARHGQIEAVQKAEAQAAQQAPEIRRPT